MAHNEMIIVEAGDGNNQEPMLEVCDDNVSANCAGGASDTDDDEDMGVRHCFYDFCKQTILHGWHYLADIESHPTPSTSFVGAGNSDAGMYFFIWYSKKKIFYQMKGSIFIFR